LSGPSYSLKDLADKVQGKLVGDPAVVIHSIATIQNASSGCISFIANPKYNKFLSASSASAIIVSPELSLELKTPGIIADDPYVAYAKFLHCLQSIETHIVKNLLPTISMNHPRYMSLLSLAPMST
jgi:UDP-3-O-[3-hydroxymyristoyl] glucosamine N-acyltransferase